MKIKTELTKLKDTDVYSLILFALFKMKDLPEYSSLSELVYVLDKDSLLKLCEYFGGQTITIPTIDELETMVYSLILYQYVNIEGIEYEKAVELIGCNSSEKRKLKAVYNKMCSILSHYKFTRGDNADSV